MRIGSDFTIKNIPSFGAKSYKIRKADDIQRKARSAFPFFSPSYAKLYYPCCKETKKGNIINANKTDELEVMRKDREYDKLPATIKQVIEDTDRQRLANCGEASLIIMSALLANGFPDSHRCSVILHTGIYDKQTGEQCFEIKFDLDHACVISTMEKDSKSNKPYIVLDSWHGFADSMTGAKGRYIQYTNKEELDEAENVTIEEFELESGKPFNPEKYEYKSNIDFEIIDSPTKEDNKSIKKLCRSRYNQLIFDEFSSKKD